MFKTDTCPYCVEMQKELSYVSKEREGKFNIYYARLEEEKNIDLAYKYDANVVPTTVFLDKEGNKFYVHQGLMRKNNIETILNSLGVKQNMEFLAYFNIIPQNCLLVNHNNYKRYTNKLM